MSYRVARQPYSPAAVPDAPVRPIPGYEGFYSVSADGRVWSEPRHVSASDGLRRIHVGGLWLRQHQRPKGYLFVRLRKGRGVTKAMGVHRLVAMAWIPRRSGDADQVNHKNGVKTDNRVANLEWVSNQENVAHAYRTGLVIRKLTKGQVRQIKLRIKSGDVQSRIARQYGVAVSTISRIKHGILHGGQP